MTIRLAVGIPAYGGKVASGHAKMWMQFGGALARERVHSTLSNVSPVIELVQIVEVDVCGVDRARNILLQSAIDIKADWLLMIDADTWVGDGTDLVRMIIDANQQQAAIVGAPVQTRGGNCLNVYFWDSTNQRHQSFNIGNDDKWVDAIGGAIMGVNLRKLAGERFSNLHRPDGTSMSEDLWFCRQLRLRGEDILVDARVSTFHAGHPARLTYTPSEIA